MEDFTRLLLTKWAEIANHHLIFKEVELLLVSEVLVRR
jgi:hypothetical protein